MHNGFKHVSLSSSDLYIHCQSPCYLRGDGGGGRNADLADMEQSAVNGFRHLDASDFSRSLVYNGIKASSVSDNLHFGGLTNSLGSTEMGSPGRVMVDTGQIVPRGENGIMGFVGSNLQFENWTDSSAVVVNQNSQQTDASTETTDGKTQFPGAHNKTLAVEHSIDQSNAKFGDQKTLSRLAQNREAAKKSRMRKKAYVKQLENSRQRLEQLEQDLKRARQQGLFIAPGYSGDQSHSISGIGPTTFDVDYACWLDEHQRLMNDLRSAVNSQASDSELKLSVDRVMSHYSEEFQLKSLGTKLDVFHILSGMWKTPVERCFMWLGGFRSSDVLKVLGSQIEPLTEQQLVSFCNLQQSCQQTEDALSQGMEALQQSISDTLSSNSVGPHNINDYMSQMAVAMSKLTTLQNFLHQADLLRLQILQQMHRILTTHQAARAHLAINDYKSRLRALSSLWLARPKG